MLDAKKNKVTCNLRHVEDGGSRKHDLNFFFLSASDFYTHASSCCACRPDGQADKHIKMKILWGQDMTPYYRSFLVARLKILYLTWQIKKKDYGSDDKHIKMKQMYKNLRQSYIFYGRIFLNFLLIFTTFLHH